MAKKKKSDMKKSEKSATRPGKEAPERKRLNRLIGQVEGVRRMLEAGRPAEDILAQCKAVHSGLRAIEAWLLEEHLLRTLEDFAEAGRKDRTRMTDELVALYRPVG